jgi:small subunit ribosomal protein S15
MLSINKMLKNEEKEKLIKATKIHESDTGSFEVQIVLLNAEIKKLLLHLKKHPKDYSSKRGLLKMVAKRRKLLKHLKEEEPKRYSALIKKIGAKK